MASLTIICGPMFSGKTEAVLEIARVAEGAGATVVLLKPSVDSRHPGEVVSHAGSKHSAVTFETGNDLLAAATEADIVVVDEVQFVAEDAVVALRHLVESGVEVVAAGLDLDFREQPFPSVAALRVYADSAQVLTATCTSCGGVATRTQRFGGGVPASFDEPVISVGGEETYQPRCPLCFARERLEVKS